MATMALPIRELSASVQYDAARVQNTFWKVVDRKTRAATFDVGLMLQAKILSYVMGRLVTSQSKLIDRLKALDSSSFDEATFDKVACDLERIVALTNSFLSDAYAMPSKCVDVWRLQLEQISDLSCHIDNFSESFRIASDDACTAVLAHIAEKITADVLTPAT